jgi:hypothetical protein
VQNSNSVTNNVYFGSRTETFDVPGQTLWTVPPGVRMVSVQIWGAGGGGGGASTLTTNAAGVPIAQSNCQAALTLAAGCCGGGGGGGSGAYVRSVVQVKPGDKIEITVGMGGQYSEYIGHSGLASSIRNITVASSEIITAAGGTGGGKANAVGCANTGYGGNGAQQLPQAGQFVISGSTGQPGSFAYNLNVGCMGGSGASAPGGGGGPNTSPAGGGNGDSCYASGRQGGSPGGNGRVTIQY